MTSIREGEVSRRPPPVKVEENSRKFSPAFSRNRKASILRVLARKAEKYERKTS